MTSVSSNFLHNQTELVSTTTLFAANSSVSPSTITAVVDQQQQQKQQQRGQQAVKMISHTLTNYTAAVKAAAHSPLIVPLHTESKLLLSSVFLVSTIIPIESTTSSSPFSSSSSLSSSASPSTTSTTINSAFIQINLSANNNASSISSSSSTSSSSSSGSSANNSIYTNLTTAPTADSYLISMAWSKTLIVAIFLLLILVTIVGNTLVILSVLTTRRLRTVTNCFVMNLAITDWLVGTCVMPPSVILYIVGSWRFGWILCDIWISLDVLLCTGSILSLCAISLDRYLAVTQPLTYSKKRRSKRLALFMIFVVWVTALSITCPPYLGWYETGRRQKGYVDCRYNQNKGYVVFSAMGSFFIPLIVMLYVYLKIGYVLTSRRQRIVRDANSERTAADHDLECDNFLYESEHFQCATPSFSSFKSCWINNVNNTAANNKSNSLKCSKCNKNYIEQNGGLKHQSTFYELVEVTRLSSLIHCSQMACKYGENCVHSTPVRIPIVSTGMGVEQRSLNASLHYVDSMTSFSESCLNAANMNANITNISTRVTYNPQQQQQKTQAHLQNYHSHHQHQHQQLHDPHQHHHHHHHHRVPMRVSTTKRDTKTAKTLTIVMGGFIACWLPFFTYYLLIPFLPPTAVLQGLMSFLTWVGWVNCAINPFIYAFYNPDFRIAFWRLTCRRICKQKTTSNHMAMFRG